MTNTQIVIAELPSDSLTPAHFKQTTADMPVAGDGQVLLKVILMSIDAANRSWMKGATYRAAVNAGDAMPTYAICEVVESNSGRLAVGDIVASEATWSNFVVADARKCEKLPKVPQLSNLMSVYGIAGGAEKCKWVTEELGFDACIDYRAPGMSKALRAACPDGVDVYFDNVGGTVLEAALFAMNEKGRIVCCGAVSQYDTETPTGPRNLPGLVVVKRLRMEGFIVMDWTQNDAKALRALQTWVEAGQIKVTEDIVDGLENAPQALIGLLAGENKGKRMVRVAADPS